MSTASPVELFAKASPAGEPLVERDPGRLRQLVDEHYDFLWRGLRRLGVPEGDVDDALQTVFVTADRKLREVEVGRERSYLFGIAVRVASNARRTDARKRKVFDDASLDDFDVADPARDELEMRDLLERALEPLSMELRTVFVLFELDEMTAAEIAELLDVPLGTVSSRLRRAREIFSARAEELRTSLEAGGTQ